MTNDAELIFAIKRAGKRINDVCADIGLSKQSFLKKRKGECDFRANEIEKITKSLGLSGNEMMSIFFACEVGKMETGKGDEPHEGQTDN